MRSWWKLGVVMLSALSVSSVMPHAEASGRPRQSPAGGPSVAGELIAVEAHDNPHSGSYCSSGFAWRTPEGHQWVLTSGHCLREPGQSPYPAQYASYGSGARGASLGTGSDQTRFLSGNDFGLIYPSAAPRAAAYTGAANSQSARWVTATGENRRGVRDVCVSGGISGELCGWTVVDYHARQNSTEDANLGPQWVLSRARHGSCPTQSGDSGSPVYLRNARGITALGIVSTAGESGSRCYTSYVGVERIMQVIGGGPLLHP